MRINLMAILLFLLWSSFCVAGQYYKFVDENGVVSFTDDLSKIPKEQRPEVEVSEEIEGRPEIQNNTAQEEKRDPVEKARDLESEAEALKAIKAELDRESEAINSASTILIEQGKDIKGVRNIDQYNIRVEELNARTNDYHQKQADYVKRVNEYNAKVDAQPVKEKK